MLVLFHTSKRPPPVNLERKRNTDALTHLSGGLDRYRSLPMLKMITVGQYIIDLLITEALSALLRVIKK